MPLSLKDSIHSKIASLQKELREARRKIETLERRPLVAQSELSFLRRGVAFHCHPDRGGDALLMRQVNCLFDLLEGSAS